MPSLLFETAIKMTEEGEPYSYWPDKWPVSRLMQRLRSSGSAFFAASYMNDPSALEGNSLKVSWLHTYTQGELEAYRAEFNVPRGVVWCGIDPSIGGKEANNLDYFAMFSIEVLGNKGFCKDFYFDRLEIDEQGERVEWWLDTQRPDRVILEEQSSRGYVHNTLTTQINDGLGSKWPIEVRQAQGSKDKGGKRIRLQKMAARFENQQLRIPAEMMPNGELVVSPHWAAFVNQWRTFPSGHDDILDAAYWAQYEAFDFAMPFGATKAPEVDKEDPYKPTVIKRDDHTFRGISSVMARHNARRMRSRMVRRGLLR